MPPNHLKIMLAGLFILVMSASGCSTILKSNTSTAEIPPAQKKVSSADTKKSKTIIKYIEKKESLAKNAFFHAMNKVKASGEKNTMVVTNAGYGNLDGKSSEAMIDAISAGTGCTPGKRTLLTVHTPCNEPFWATVINTDTFKAIFLQSSKDGLKKTELNLSPKTVLTPQGWLKARSTDAGKRLFSIVSIAYAAKAGASWDMLRAAELHDHFCPGLNAGFLVRSYMEKAYPLGKGDKYVFVGAPPICAMDALQSIFGTTVGKRGTYAMDVAPKVNGAIASNGAKPVIIAMRVNTEKNKTDGVIIGFDFDRISDKTGVRTADLKPAGGPANPLFYISRVKVSWKMAQMPMKDKMPCLEVIKRFNRPAKTAAEVQNAKANPYAPLILPSY